VVVHAYNPSTQKGKAEGSQVQGQPGPHSKTVFQTKQNKNKIKKRKKLTCYVSIPQVVLVYTAINAFLRKEKHVISTAQIWFYNS
jgi:hypothetical protein